MRTILLTAVMLLVVAMESFIGGHYQGKGEADRWYAQHETCFSKEPIAFSGVAFSPAPMTGTATEVTLDNGQMVVSIDYDGKVHFGKGMTADKASRAFWLKMGQDLKHCRGKSGR